MRDFTRAVFLTLLMTYVVILAGAVVRGTGSGLGCPDWPSCFGQWVPPVHVSELPADYKDIYKVNGRVIADFDAFKTWVEYVNRLLGVILGFMILKLFFKSFSYKDKEPNLPWYCGGILLLTLLQGGIGALVVFSHLQPFIITMHMFIACILLFSLHYLKKYCSDLDSFSVSFKPDTKHLPLTKILLGLTLVQILMGTQVREQVDHLVRDMLAATPASVINELDWMFYVHRTFSLALVGLTGYIVFRLYRHDVSGSAFKHSVFIFFLLLLNMASGIGLNYFGFPAKLQPPHLFVGILLFGQELELYLTLRGTLVS